MDCLRSISSWTTAATSPGSPFIANALKLLPLLGRQYCLQSTIGLAPNLVHPWFRLPAYRSQLLASVGKDLLHFWFLVVSELQFLCHLLKPVTPITTERKASVHIQCEDARGKSKHEDNRRRDANLPPVFRSIVHN
jgi:hypothetical protein